VIPLKPPQHYNTTKSENVGRAIVQAVSRRLPTAAAQVRAQVKSCGGQSVAGAGFLQVVRFPLPILIPPTAPHSSSIIRGWYNRPNSGRRAKWTQSPHHKKKSPMGVNIIGSLIRRFVSGEDVDEGTDASTPYVASLRLGKPT
jgi:hypothetical protein